MSPFVSPSADPERDADRYDHQVFGPTCRECGAALSTPPRDGRVAPVLCPTCVMRRLSPEEMRVYIPPEAKNWREPRFVLDEPES